VWRCTTLLFTSFVVSLLFGFYFYEPHIELAFYSRNRVTTQIEPIVPLRGCFDPSSPYQDALYNVSDALWGSRKTEIQSGMSLRMGLDCYDLAGTIPPPTPYNPSVHKYTPGEKRLQFHTFWRTDLYEFGKRVDSQELVLDTEREDFAADSLV
jgi:hypothetical protein